MTILKIRELRTNEEGLRAFVPPKVNWETSTSYDRFISDADFKDPQNLHEPPVTMSWLQQEIMDVAGDPSLFKLRHVPAHTTPVERQISLGTQLAKNYQVEDCSPEDMHFEQEMANMKADNSVVPSYKSKQDYRPHLEPPPPPPPPPPPRLKRASAAPADLTPEEASPPRKRRGNLNNS